MSNVILLYECDVWLTTQSRQLVAICSNKDKLKEMLYECYCSGKFPRISAAQLDELLKYGQSQCGNECYENNFITEEVETDKVFG